MGEDCGSWGHQQYSVLKLPNLNCMGTAPYIGKQNMFQPFAKSYTCMVPANGSLPGLAVPLPMLLNRSQGNEERQPRIFQTLEKPPASVHSADGYLPGLAVPSIPYSKTSQGIEQQQRFCCLPYYCRPGTPLADIVLKENFLAPNKNGNKANSNVVSGSVEQRFLIFHQFGHGTSLMFNSLIASRTQNPNLETGPPIERCGSQQKEFQVKRDEIAHPCPLNTDGLSENQETSEEGEMHENTEEIDALLYSDSEYSVDDDDETSTAHSPCENRGWCKNQEGIEESEDEVTSHVCAKRKRPLDEEDEESFLRDTASSLGLSDAESGFVHRRSGENSGSSEANKRLKMDKILDAMSILQSIIPGEKGKDTALILDDAIKYLKFLRLKAKSLGVAVE